MIGLVASCIPTDAEPNETPVDPASSPFHTATGADGFTGAGDPVRPLTRLVVEFSVHRFTAPQGTFSSKDSMIWRVISSPLPSAATTLQLADSGFRAAIGKEPERRAFAEAIAVLREKTEVRSVMDRILPDASREIEIDIGPASWPRLAVFYVNASGSLAGQDFQDAKVKFLMTFAIRPENLKEVWLQLMPAIEEPPGPPRWVGMPGGGFQQVPEQRRRVFSEMTFSAPIPEGGFLLLGPTEIVYERPYLARPFFIEQAAGSEKKTEVRESVYIISPILRTEREGTFGRGGGTTGTGSR